MPFESLAQSRACFAQRNRGENGSWDCSEWAHATDYKKLPKKVRGEKAAEFCYLLGKSAAEKSAAGQPNRKLTDLFNMEGSDMDSGPARARMAGRGARSVPVNAQSPAPSRMTSAVNSLFGKEAPAKPSLPATQTPAAPPSLATGSGGGGRGLGGGAVGGAGGAGRSGGGSLVPRGGGPPDGRYAMRNPTFSRTVRPHWGRIAAALGLAGAGGVAARMLGGSGESAGAISPVPTAPAPVSPAPTPPAAASGLSPTAKLLLGVGGLGLGAYGAFRLMGGKKKEDEEKAAAALSPRERQKLALDRYRETVRQNAPRLVCAYLDKAASSLPFESQGPVRVLQQALSAGKPLATAVKLAAPYLSGESRGLFMAQLVRATVHYFNKAANGDSGVAPPQTTTPETFSGPVDGGMDWMNSQL